MVKTLIITGYGINADKELADAFESAGSTATRTHINDIIENPEIIHNFHIIGFPGGFSFGDHLGSGLVFSHLFKSKLKDSLDQFVADGKLIIGICNGFQVLVKMGILPNRSGDWTQEVSLIHNDSGVFENSWINADVNNKSKCVWTKNIVNLDLPIRHGEGRFITVSDSVMNYLKENDLITLTYKGRNPNGSEDNIAGITDKTGQIFGLMPHPEAFTIPQHHPCWTRGDLKEKSGLDIFKNGVNYAKQNLL